MGSINPIAPRGDDPLTTIAKALGIARDIYGIRTDSAKLDEYAAQQKEKDDLAAGKYNNPQQLKLRTEGFDLSSAQPASGTAYQPIIDAGTGSTLYASLKKDTSPLLAHIVTTRNGVKGTAVIDQRKLVPGKTVDDATIGFLPAAPDEVKPQLVESAGPNGTVIKQFVDPTLGQTFTQPPKDKPSVQHIQVPNVVREGMTGTLVINPDTKAEIAFVPQDDPAAKNKLDERFSKFGADLTSGLASSRSDLGVQQGIVSKADRLLALAEQAKTQKGGLDKRQVEELAIASANLVGGATGGAESTIKALVPQTYTSNAAGLAEWLGNAPKGTDQQAFVDRMAESAQREKFLATEKIKSTKSEVLSSYADLKNKDADRWNQALAVHFGDNPQFDKNGRYVMQTYKSPSITPRTPQSDTAYADDNSITITNGPDPLDLLKIKASNGDKKAQAYLNSLKGK